MNIAQLCAATGGVAPLTLTLALGAGNAHGKDLVPSAPPLRGQVVDVDAGQPIANALVMMVAAVDYSSLSMHGGHRVDSPNLSATTRDAIGTREGLGARFRHLQIDIEGPTAPAAPRQTSRGKRVTGEITETRAR